MARGPRKIPRIRDKIPWVCGKILGVFFTVITGRLAMEPTKIPGILDGFPTFGYASLFDFIETIHFYFLWINLNLGNF